jgi:ubiquinone/menaquinone biosynthesis C-methylase UbiE
MLKVAKGRASTIPIPIHLARADGCHLPFVDNSFDAVFHFGGINMFGNVRQGIEEMVRVAKPDAPVIISDEGMSERRRKTWIGRRLGEMNTLNLCRPPFADIPWDHVHAFELHWAWRELFYVLSFRKGNDPKASVGTPQEEVHRRIKT